MQNANAENEYIVECLAHPTHPRTSSPSLAVLRNIVNGGDGSPKFTSVAYLLAH